MKKLIALTLLAILVSFLIVYGFVYWFPTSSYFYKAQYYHLDPIISFIVSLVLLGMFFGLATSTQYSTILITLLFGTALSIPIASIIAISVIEKGNLWPIAMVFYMILLPIPFIGVVIGRIARYLLSKATNKHRENQ